MSIIDKFDFSGLTLDEKAILAHELWDSLHEEADSLQLNQEIKDELDRRLAAEEAGLNPYVSWEEVKKHWRNKA